MEGSCGFIMDSTIFWLILLIFMVVLEAATMSFGIVAFAFGALGALIIDTLGGPLWLQILVFGVFSLLFLLLLRPILIKKLNNPETARLNADAVIGETATVVESVAPNKPGVVKIQGKEWTAIVQDQGESFEIGALVKVLRIEGVKLVITANIKEEK
jgi:membrane protein implicated in regulation of membrane protease activity